MASAMELSETRSMTVETSSQGFSRNVEMLAEQGYLDGDPVHADKEQIAYAIGQLLDHFNPLH